MLGDKRRAISKEGRKSGIYLLSSSFITAAAAL